MSRVSADQETDRVVWGRLLNGNQEAMTYFYEKYADHLLRYGLSLTPDRELISDAVQELFITLWTRRNQLSIPDSVRHYLMASLRRRILRAIRSEKRNIVVTAEVPDVADEHGDDDEMHQYLQRAVRSLPARQQELVFLKYYEKLSYEQITALTGLEYQVLRNTLYRALKTLRGTLVGQVDLLLTVFFCFFL